MDQSNAADALTPTAALVSLAGRRAVVTGAGRGIGAAIAHRLADAGAAGSTSGSTMPAFSLRPVPSSVTGVVLPVDGGAIL